LDLDEAKKIIDDDININKKRWDIEEKCITIIATQQPVAMDLREIITILNIIVELERMGDYAAGIAKITILHGKQPHLKPLIDIPRIVEEDIKMIQDSLKSFIEKDVALAKATWNKDNEIDQLYNQILREVITYMLEDPHNITRATYNIWVAHNLERIADRVTNICERIVFLKKGKMEKMETNGEG
jgi:phosphate transport system protein